MSLVWDGEEHAAPQLSVRHRQMKNRLETKLLEILGRHPWFMSALDAVSDLEIPQWCIGAGVIRNIVFDHLDGVAKTTIRDVDIAYYDVSDITEQADRRYEDILKQRMPFVPWEVTNQASVHLWFHKKFGYRVPPVDGIAEAVATWPETCTSVGVTKIKGNGYKVYAPYGLKDLFGMVIRRNPTRIDINTYNKRISTKRYRQHWKSVRIIYENGEHFAVVDSQGRAAVAG
jgi:hypothetical protein